MANTVNGIFVKLDTQNTHQPQATIIPFATPSQGGAMSPEQAAKLASLGPSPAPSNANPLPDAPAAAPGTSLEYSRADHVHPAEGGGPEPSDDLPFPDGQGSPGGSDQYSRGDHEHPGPYVVGPISDDNYDIDLYQVVQGDSSEGPLSFNMPPAGGNPNYTVTVWVIPGGSTITLQPAGTDKLNGVAAPFAIASGSRTFISNGLDNWLLIATA